MTSSIANGNTFANILHTESTIAILQDLTLWLAKLRILGLRLLSILVVVFLSTICSYNLLGLPIIIKNWNECIGNILYHTVVELSIQLLEGE